MLLEWFLLAGEAVREELLCSTLQVTNPETGELYGPRGKEPTRFGEVVAEGPSRMIPHRLLM